MLIVGPALASPRERCPEPDVPYCVRYPAPFPNNAEFAICRREVQSFLDDAKEFRACLAKWHTESQDQSKQATERFNCLASGQKSCP